MDQSAAQAQLALAKAILLDSHLHACTAQLDLSLPSVVFEARAVCS